MRHYLNQELGPSSSMTVPFFPQMTLSSNMTLLLLPRMRPSSSTTLLFLPPIVPPSSMTLLFFLLIAPSSNRTLLLFHPMTSSSNMTDCSDNNSWRIADNVSCIPDERIPTLYTLSTLLHQLLQPCLFYSEILRPFSSLNERWDVALLA